MNMDHAREMLADALQKGLRLHGISAGGKPAISFDQSHPDADKARQQFHATRGLVRELLRAAMINECYNRGLPADLAAPQHPMRMPVSEAHAAMVH